MYRNASALPRPLRAGILAGTVVTAGLLLAAPASAHVTVSADDPAKGAADTILTFRVPNEADDATTTKVEISFPEKTPIASVLPGPVPGWTFSTKTVTFATPISTDDGDITEGVTSVTYTADGKGIPVGGFQAFTLLVGPLPEDADALSFPTVQTYSNGDVDRWVDPVVEGQDEPESPAPTLALAAATAGGEAPAPSESAEPAATVSASAPATDGGTTAAADDGGSDDSGSGSNGLGIAGLALGAVGALLGGAAFARSGRSAG